jgi:nicotinate phosphoribosyltransferase
MEPRQDPNSGTFTDLYELTMAAGYFHEGRKDRTATFDYFFRDNPYEGGYTVLAGLDELLDEVESFRFGEASIDFLRQYGFAEDFLSYLKEFRFSGTIRAPKEGEIVFPGEPVLRVEGNIIESQLLETLVLNRLNFASLIATKAARIRSVAGDRLVADFGLRRAQGSGGMLASLASVIGGAEATSNVMAGFRYGIPITGTMAHSWVQSYDEEIEAFRAFARQNPDNSILLVDTYDSIGQGVPNAIRVGKEMAERGQKLRGIRLDSGDLAYLSKKARKMLDDAGLTDSIITVSNQLDEYVIDSLLDQEAPIDGFGVGTRLVTGQPDAALDGVYKLAEADGSPRMKLSDNVAKTTLPGKKQVHRFYNEDGSFYGDGIALEEEGAPSRIQHPHFPDRRSSLSGKSSEPLLRTVMEGGARTDEAEPVEDKKERCLRRLKQLAPEHRRFQWPHIYKVGISEKLHELRTRLQKELSP